MVTEDYVSFETAKLLKEKGFDGDTNCYYIEGSVDKNLWYSPIRQNHNKRITNNEFDINIDITSSKISAPTLQMAMKWLREVHKLHIDVDPSEGDWNPTVLELEDWTCAVKFGNNIPIQDSYEEACEAAIKYCLENLI